MRLFSSLSRLHFLLPAAALLLAAAAALTGGGCANTSAAPTGGVKDTIPPVLLGSQPAAGTVRFAGKHIYIQFNEFVQLTDANSQVVLSPPLKQKLTTRTKGRGVMVRFEEPLEPDQTYCLYFGNAIADNNEKNPFPNYALSFSTGDALDSLMLSGLVLDAQTMLPVADATVLMHIALTDTTLATTLPRALTKTDEWGWFCLRNLKDTLYHLFVITDENNNYLYEPESEKFAFLDTLIRPSRVMSPEAPELVAYDPTDTLGLLARPVELNLNLFQAPSKRQTLKSKTRVQDRLLTFKFGAPGATIRSLQLEGIDSTALIRQDNHLQDSVMFWINQLQVPDTLRGIIQYDKTDDSLGTLVPAADTFALVLASREAEAQRERDRKQREQPDSLQREPTPRELRRPAPRDRPRDFKAAVAEKKQELQDEAQGTGKKRDDLLRVDINVGAETVEQEGFKFKFASWPLSPSAEGIRLSHITTRKDTVPDSFTFERDFQDSCLFYLKAKRWEKATTYLLEVPERIFTDVNGFTNDSLRANVNVPSPDEFSSLTLTLTGCPGPCLIDLMDENRTQVRRSHWIQGDTTVVFGNLKAEKFSLRITEDRNGNRLWDTGNYETRLQAERVRIYSLPGGSQTLELKEKTDLSQSIDLTTLFNTNVSLTIPQNAKGQTRR